MGREAKQLRQEINLLKKNMQVEGADEDSSDKFEDPNSPHKGLRAKLKKQMRRRTKKLRNIDDT